MFRVGRGLAGAGEAVRVVVEAVAAVAVAAAVRGASCFVGLRLGVRAASPPLNMFTFWFTYICVVFCIARDVCAGLGAPRRDMAGCSYEGGGVPRFAALILALILALASGVGALPANFEPTAGVAGVAGGAGVARPW